MIAVGGGSFPVGADLRPFGGVSVLIGNDLIPVSGGVFPVSGVWFPITGISFLIGNGGIPAGRVLFPIAQDYFPDAFERDWHGATAKEVCLTCWASMGK